MGHTELVSLHVGTAEAVITPPVGLRLLGPLERSTGVHDDLLARSVVLDDGHTTVALVFLDLIGLDLALSHRISDEITNRTGIANVLINCTHTHSAPFTIPWSAEGREEYENEARGWLDQLVSSVAEIAVEAAGRKRESSVRVGRAEAQVGMNRRLPTEKGIEMQPNPDGPVIKWVDVLAFDAIGGGQKVVLATHAAHPVIVHGASTLISADYPGFAVEEVRRLLGGDVTAVFAQGCCGNINGEPLQGGIEAAREAGSDLARAIIEACENAQAIVSPRIGTCSEHITLPLQELPTADQCRHLVRDQEELLKAAPDDFVEQWYARNNVLCSQQLCLIVDRGKQPAGVRFEINGLTLGDDFCLVAMTDEVFCDFQLWTGAYSPFKHTMVWAYTNGCEMYIPTDSALALGGMEAASAPTPGYTSGLYYHNRLALRTGAEALVKKGIEKVMACLPQAADFKNSV